jgi:hypothetical protein
MGQCIILSRRERTYRMSGICRLRHFRYGSGCSCVQRLMRLSLEEMAQPWHLLALTVGNPLQRRALRRGTYEGNPGYWGAPADLK